MLGSWRTRSERQRLAIQYFLEHPQPTERSNWPPPGKSVYEQRFLAEEDRPKYRTPPLPWPDRKLRPLEWLEASESPDAPAAGPPSASQVASEPARRKRSGKAYPADAAVAVIRRVLDERPSRALNLRGKPGPEKGPANGAAEPNLPAGLAGLRGFIAVETCRAKVRGGSEPRRADGQAAQHRRGRKGAHPAPCPTPRSPQ